MSNIAWTNETWNPVTGCSKVSPGCAHCYAEALSLRRGWSQKPWTPENAGENVVLHPERLRKPLSWRSPRRVFVNSMSDLFHEQVPFDFVDKVFAVMALTPQHTYQILTKRPERMLTYMGRRANGCTGRIYFEMGQVAREMEQPRFEWPLPNVWLGTSVENQHWADVRIPILTQVPAEVRFLSCEPLLGPVDLRAAHHMWAFWISWVIVGGESGPGRREMDLQWARDIRDQCKVAIVPFFFKQHSGPRPEMNTLLDGQEWHQYPERRAA